MKGDFIVDKSGERLDKIILEKLTNLSRARIKNLIDNGEILLNGKQLAESLLSATGSFLGFIFGTGIKLVASAMMLFYIIKFI